MKTVNEIAQDIEALVKQAAVGYHYFYDLKLWLRLDSKGQHDMTTKDEALIELIEDLLEQIERVDGHGPRKELVQRGIAAITAIKQAQQTQELVPTNMSYPLRIWKDDASAWMHCRSAWGVGGMGLTEAEAIKSWAVRNPKEVERLGLGVAPKQVK